MSIRRKFTVNFLWSILPPLLFMAFMLLLFPITRQFEFDSDESVQLLKAMMTDKGYPLYSSVWNDQPPLLNVLLVATFKLFGYRTSAARGLVLLLSAILFWASFQFLSLAAGKRTAIIGAILLILLPQLPTLSVSVMVGLPAIALAMVSLLALAYWHRKRNYLYLIASAAALSLSIFTKLFTGILVPVFLIGLLIAESERFRQERNFMRLIAPTLVWGGVFALTFAVLLFEFVGLANVKELFLPHLQGRSVTFFQAQKLTINYHLLPVLLIFFYALIGTYYIFLEQRWLLLYLVAWGASAYIFLLTHAPVWGHQQVLVTIPTAMVAAFLLNKIAASIDTTEKESRQILTIVIAGTLLFLFFFRFSFFPDSGLATSIRSSSNNSLLLFKAEERLLNTASNYAGDTNWIVTDKPMIAFLIKKPSPPNLVVITDKRLMTKNLTQKEIIETIREYRPEQVLFGRWDFPQVNKYLKDDYTLVLQETLNGVDAYLFVRNDIVQRREKRSQ